MLDGSIDATGETDKERRDALNTLCKHYNARTVKAIQIPKGMKIQGVDIIDPDANLVLHQLAFKGQIEALHAKHKQACIVIFTPITPAKTTQQNFNIYHDPNRYAVMTVPEAEILLKNKKEYQGLKKSVYRRSRIIVWKGLNP